MSGRLHEGDRMGNYINRGNKAFAEKKNAQVYVDKTGLLTYTNSVLDTMQRFIFNSRPSGFGKTMAAVMLEAYYGKGCDSRNLFTGLKITKDDAFEKHLNQYDVIFLDMMDIYRKIEDSMELVPYITEKVREELEELYPGIILNGLPSLTHALTQINVDTDIRFVFIIDNWDAIFWMDRYNEEAHEEYMRFLSSLFKSSISQCSIKLAYLTGIMPLKRPPGDLSSINLNNFDLFTMTRQSRLSEYIGFTEQEVMELCRNCQKDFEEIKRRYDGYLMRNNLHVYHPRSIMQALFPQNMEDEHYRIDLHELLKEYLLLGLKGIKDAVLQMLSGERYEIYYEDMFGDRLFGFKRPRQLLAAMIQLGCLVCDKDEKEVYIPNEEMRDVFESVVRKIGWI